MNEIAQEILNNLQKNFNIVPVIEDQWHGFCPIGIEVEIKWRHYFPQLWEKYLKNSTYKELSEIDKEKLTQQCTILEKSLLPQLEQTLACGLEKGADKYWEFAFPPAKNMLLTIQQVEILEYADLIPQGDHSLHLTIGGLKGNKDAYYLLLLLEMLYCSSERIASAFHKENSNLSGTWARKGMGGLFVKEKHELKHGYNTAIELRTLELKNALQLKEILYLTSYISDIIYSKNLLTESNNDTSLQLKSSNIINWNSAITQMTLVLEKYGLADKNWKKPNLSPEYWQKYIECFELLSEEIKDIFEDTIKDDYLMHYQNQQNKRKKAQKIKI